MLAKLKKLVRILGGLVALAVVIVLGLVLVYEAEGDRLLPSGDRRNAATYITVRDGVRIAVDTWLPADLSREVRVPTLMRSTRYWRTAATGPLGRVVMAVTRQTGVPEDVRLFNEAGYAVVLVDVRGSGASFGRRPSEFTREEALDLGEVAGWISAQSWSNGRVGTWGVSYEGNTAAMAAVAANPAVVAIAPQYADFDAYPHLLWPGGVFASGFIGEWGKLVQAMDRNDICALAGVGATMCPILKLLAPGVKPVDDMPEGRGSALLEEAVAQHETPDVSALAALGQFRDHPFVEGGGTISDVSINGYRPDIERSSVPIYSWAGWMDAGTVDGALALFSSFDNPVRLSIGPWSHGGGHNTDPFLADDAPTDPDRLTQARLLLDFFDHYVRDGAEDPAPGIGRVSYYTFGEGWKETPSWPPSGLEPTRWYFGESHTLGRAAPTDAEAADAHEVDFSHSTGDQTRWHTQLGGSDVIYGDRSLADGTRLTYTSEPMSVDTEITGAVEVDLYVSSTREDGAFFAYLEVVGPTGFSRYVTEGMLRAVHRAECPGPAPYPIWGPCHTFAEADAMPLVPGEVALVRFSLFNTSVLVPSGHRIRIALAGSDASVFDRYPPEGAVDWSLHRAAERPSGVVIPMRQR